MSEAKRDLAQTGNMKLRPSTVRTLSNSDSLLALRSRMGASATGFESTNCKQLRSKKILLNLTFLSCAIILSKLLYSSVLYKQNYFMENNKGTSPCLKKKCNSRMLQSFYLYLGSDGKMMTAKTQFNVKTNEKNCTQTARTELGDPLHGHSSCDNYQRPTRERKQTKLAGTGVISSSFLQFS